MLNNIIVLTKNIAYQFYKKYARPNVKKKLRKGTKIMIKKKK